MGCQNRAKTSTGRQSDSLPHIGPDLIGVPNHGNPKLTHHASSASLHHRTDLNQSANHGHSKVDVNRTPKMPACTTGSALTGMPDRGNTKLTHHASSASLPHRTGLNWSAKPWQL